MKTNEGCGQSLADQPQPLAAFFSTLEESFLSPCDEAPNLGGSDVP